MKPTLLEVKYFTKKEALKKQKRFGRYLFEIEKFLKSKEEAMAIIKKCNPNSHSTGSTFYKKRFPQLIVFSRNINGKIHLFFVKKDKKFNKSELLKRGE